MRIPRSLILTQTGGLVHKFWRAHNREFLLAKDSNKSLYLHSIQRALTHKSVQNEVSVHAFCVMSNHAHTLASYKSTSGQLSSFMRVAHGHFGQKFNRIHKRQGPVAYDRPKTPLVQNKLWNILRVHFYIEANPLRARMVRDLKCYRFSSFAFYAWGKKTEHTKLLSIPQWYTDLGKTDKERQSKYRALFNQYLEEIRFKMPSLTRGDFIGDTLWVSDNKKYLADALRLYRDDGRPPPLSVPA